MSRPEQRLRERLDRVTARVEPDVDRHLHQSLQVGHRRIVVRRIGAAAGAALAIVLVVIAGTRLSDGPDRVPASPTPSVPSPGPVFEPSTLIGTWRADLRRADVEAALAAGGLETWLGEMTGSPGPPIPLDLELTFDGTTYSIGGPDGEAVKEGSYTVEGDRIILIVDPNGVTVLTPEIVDDQLTLTFVSNSTQPYPPDMPPEEAIQRVLYGSAPFTRD